MPNAIIKLRALLDSDDAVRLIKLLGIIALMAILEVAYRVHSAIFDIGDFAGSHHG